MRLLLATDGSEYSRAAARFLACLDLSSSDEITVLYFMDRIPLQHGEDIRPRTLDLDEVKAELAPRVIAAALEDLGDIHAKVSTVMTEGSSRQCVADAAAASDADIVVIGAKGTKGIKSLFAGSVARSVVADSSKPVLVVKPPVPKPDERMRILFATDCSDHSSRAETFLASMPFREDADMAVIHVVLPFLVEVPDIFASEVKDRFVGTESSAAVRLCKSRDILNEAREQLMRKFSRIETLSATGDPSTEILKVASALKTDLIVTGCRGLRGLKKMLGSVSGNVLAHSSCSVLICRG